MLADRSAKRRRTHPCPVGDREVGLKDGTSLPAGMFLLLPGTLQSTAQQSASRRRAHTQTHARASIYTQARTGRSAGRGEPQAQRVASAGLLTRPSAPCGLPPRPRRGKPRVLGAGGAREESGAGRGAGPVSPSHGVRAERGGGRAEDRATGRPRPARSWAAKKEAAGRAPPNTREGVRVSIPRLWAPDLRIPARASRATPERRTQRPHRPSQALPRRAAGPPLYTDS